MLDSPDYSDLNSFDTTVLLKPAVMGEILNALSGYTVKRDDAGREAVEPRRSSRLEEADEGFLRLSSFRGKKPVLVILADPTDSWAWNFHVCDHLERLHKAYGELVEFIFVHVTVYDGYMPVYDFFGPVRERAIADHPVTLEIRALLSNGGRWDPRRSAPPVRGKPKRYIVEAGILEADKEKRMLRVQCGPSGSGPPEEPDPVEAFYISTIYPPVTEETRFDIQLTEHTRFSSIGKDGYRRLQYSDLQQGSSINIECFPDSLTARHVFDDTARVYHKDRFEKQSVWFLGIVKEIDLEKRLVSVEMPERMAAAMKGLFYWKEAGDHAQLLDATKATVPIIRRWAEGGQGARILRFQIDAAVDLFLNGESAELEDLRFGDSVGAEYLTAQDGRDRILPDVLRVSRLPI